MALKTAAQFIQARLNADLSDHAGATRACACGGTASCRGRREKRFTSILGRLCLEGTSLSPGVTRMVGFASGETSFRRSSELLRVLAGLRLDAKRVERTAEALGAEIAQDEQRRVAPACRCVRPRPPGGPASNPTAAPGPGRSRWCRGGSCGGRKTGHWNGSRAPSAIRPPSRAPPSTTPTGRCRPSRSAWPGKRPGAAWNLVAEQFPQAIQIVDLFHAKQRLWTVAQDVYGGDSEIGDAWAHARCAELEAGQFPAMRAALRTHAAAHPEAQKALVYFRNNAHRMRYAEFRRRGSGSPPASSRPAASGWSGHA